MNTIAAISTPIGHGGIGIIRISGENSLSIIKKIFKTKHNEYIPNTIVYGKIIDNNDIIDDALLSYFKAPNSYTGEDTIEINSHGGILVINRVLELVLANGATLAAPGEFTKRAFLNGKLDLSQAEAVIDLINSKTKSENENAAKQLNGDLGDVIRSIKKKILDVLVDLEANVDYPEYDIEEVSREKVLKMVHEEIDELVKISDSFDNGKIIKNGINTVIVGKPNVGKSSILNRLLKEERAIVTDIAGTTRDTIEESIIHDGIVINFVDTAGIHETSDVVEKIGVNKSLEVLKLSDLVLVVIDNSTNLSSEDIELLKLTKDFEKIVLINKIDISNDIDNKIFNYANKEDVMLISAKENKGINELLDRIKDKFISNEVKINTDIVITNSRHKEAIDKTISSLKNIEKSTIEGMPLDMVSIDLQNALSFLGEILGENVSEDIINGIFSKFCLGK